MQTSYIFISEYKQRLTRIDRATQRPPQGQPSNKQSLHGPVEYRKLLQRFRQFLAEEDKFWTQFVVRYHRSFELTEAHDALVTLGILSETTNAADESNGRNHFQFPNSSSSPPTTSTDRECRLTILSKALVCLGDIARYREQYNEAGGRPKIGPDDGTRKRSKRGGSIVDIPRPRNFEKARTCYEQAKILTPHDGNPSHQLAIIASYQKDSFTSLVHYYRSLCVKHPYETASENMLGLLSRALEQQKVARSDLPSDLAQVPKVRIEEFKRTVVVLHAMWWLGDASSNSVMIKEANNISKKFYLLVSERHLPEDFITQLVILAQGALWRVRMHQDSSTTSNKRLKLRSDSSFSPVIEAHIFTHLLSLYRALFEVGIDGLQELSLVNSDLGTRLIVEFRRTLPALRIAGKWLRSNYKYVMSDPEAQGIPDSEAKARDISPGIISPSSVKTIQFWEKFAEFLRALSRAFPVEQLPQLSFALSEDIDTRGFRPLKEYADLEMNAGFSDANVPHKESELHPNEVQLMRIEDILRDARALVEMENSPLAIYGNRFVLKGVESQVQPIPSERSLIPSLLTRGTDIDLEDDTMTDLTSGTDEILRDALRHLNTKGEDDDDDDEQIVYDPRPSGTSLDPLPKLVTDLHLVPPDPAVTSISPITPPPLSTNPLTSSKHRSTLSSPPSNQHKSPHVDKTTAEDLFKGFMNTSRSSAARTSNQSVPRSPFMFDGPGNNIWSTFKDEHAQPLHYPAGAMVHSFTPQTRQHNLSASQDISSQKSMWTHSGLQNSLPDTLPSSTFAAHLTYPVLVDPGLQHVASTSLDEHPFPSALPRNFSAEHGTVPTSYLRSEPPALNPAQNLYPHMRHLSFHDSTSYSSQAMPPMSSIWGTNG
ncbi:hypothetical protein J3R30DRAFT_16013 [Lentinula aciculospora]|uniref:Protein SMG7 n=1 Tax=Lentinula aciculospora TaxID=153920 RepID=A0A9W9ATJ5_9AGAR|nr:hypothetical protein J3R30DRAFT_16013 [Lentinula aciculospora]